MKQLTIYTANNRFQRVWDKVDTTYEKLADVLSKTKYTSETQSEYLKLIEDIKIERKKEEPDLELIKSLDNKLCNIKDVGGFTGSILKDGMRRNECILEKTLITLDIDECSVDIIDKVKHTYKEYDFIIYSTHKHQPNKPRIRLIFPISRTCTSLEYEASARYIASLLGINEFDPTTFQPARFMYFPSTSKDAEFFYYKNEGKDVDIDEILNQYKDYKDINEWFFHEKETVKNKSSVKRAQNPLLKNGYIGLFTKSYSISRAISTYLSHIYFKETETRYTYVNGTTPSGLVIYDNDTFAYSNHSTDPISGLNVNSYDLVRIHLFGNDEDSKEKMKNLITNDNRCYALKFMQDKKIEDKQFIDWFSQLEFKTSKENSSKTILPLRSNYLKIFENDKKLKKLGRYNEFSKSYDRDKNLPWNSLNSNSNNFTSYDETRVLEYLESQYGINSNIGIIKETITSYMSRHKYHPIKEYFKSLEPWDKKPRLETIFIELFGVEDNSYTRCVTKKAFVAAVARIFEAGIKFDNILTISGEEGIGKSMFFKKIAVNPLWFTDDIGNIGSKEAFENIAGAWIIEIAELDNFKNKEVTTIRNFLSKSSDKYRKAYGRDVINYARECIFFGTTNEVSFLKANNKNRRFWILEAHIKERNKHPAYLTRKDIDNLWSEAYYYYLNEGASEINKLPYEIELQANMVRKEFEETSEYKDYVIEYIKTLIPEGFENLSTSNKRLYYEYTPSERELFLKKLNIKNDNLHNKKDITAIEIISEYLPQDINITNNLTKEINEILASLSGTFGYIWNRKNRPRVNINGITKRATGSLTFVKNREDK